MLYVYKRLIKFLTYDVSLIIRLVKAARRTVTAEVTLVLFIIITTSWSIYALYRLSLGGSDNLFGINFGVNKDAQNSKESKKSISADIGTKEPLSATDIKSFRPSSTRDNLESMYGDLRNFIQGPRILATNQRFVSPTQHIRLESNQMKQPRGPNVVGPVTTGGVIQLVPSLSGQYKRVPSKELVPMVSFKIPTTNRTPINQYKQIPISIGSQLNVKERIYDNQADKEAYKDRQAAESDRNLGEQSISTIAPDDDYLNPNTNQDDYQTANSNEEPESSQSNDLDSKSVQSLDTQEIDEEQPQPSYEQSLEPVETNSDSLDQTTPSAEESTSSDGQEDPVDDSQDDKSALEESKDIDDEVDRMTQPSFGSISQETKAPENSNQVYFDDSIEPQSDTFDSKRDSQITVSDIHNPRYVTSVDPTPKNYNSRQHQELSNGKLNVIRNNSSLLNKLRKASQRNVKLEDSELPRADEANHNVPTITRANSRKTRDTVHVSRTRFKRDLLPGKDVNSIDEFTSSHPGDSDNYNSTDLNIDETEASNSGNVTGFSPSIEPNFYHLLTNEGNNQDLPSPNELNDILKVIQPSNQTDPKIMMKGSLGEASNLSTRNASDHQPASSLFTVDHGLLFYPQEDGPADYPAHKSNSHKKSNKSKHKKKMMIGYKKGGHKNKKHKKEEKKYLKEKKFKGAKKGKKIKKGKGGQGGKKGKKKFKDKGYKKKGFKNVYHKEEFGQKKSYFDEFRDKDFKKKWKKYDDNYKYAQMKKWQAKDVKGAKKMKDHGEKYKKYDKSRWKKKFHKESKEHKASKKES